MSFFSSTRSVLILGDEGLQVFYVNKSNAKRLAYLPWNTHEFESSLIQVLVKQAKRAPVVVLNDMVEQHYRKEHLLKVSVMDRSSVLKRRLNLAFPNYPIRAALKLKDKKSRVADKPGEPYLFAAIPASSAFTKTFDAISASQVSIVGLYLLPVEAASMVKALSLKLAKDKSYLPAWTIFVGQHHNGGLRQIVTRNGDLALTRLTPIVDTDIEPELWAKEVASELNATMTYLTRFGYNETDGLQVIIVAGDNAAQPLREFIKIECDLAVMNVTGVAKVLGKSLTRQEDLRYADPLHALMIGNKKSFILPLQTPVLQDLIVPRKIASFVTMALFLGCAYLGVTAFQNLKASAELSDKILLAEQRKSSIDQAYSLELEKKKMLGFDFLQVNNALEVYAELNLRKALPLIQIRDIGKSLGADIHLDKMMMKVVEEKKEQGFGYDSQEGGGSDNVLETVLTISFPSSIAPDISVQRVNAIRDKLAEVMPQNSVKVIKQIADLSYTGNFTGQAGVSENQQPPEEYEAEIEIRGAIR